MSMKNLDCDNRPDPVDRLVRNLSAEEMVEWLVQYKGLPAEAAENVEQNYREQLAWHRLQGRLDRRPFLIVIAELLGVRGSPLVLERPSKTQ